MQHDEHLARPEPRTAPEGAVMGIFIGNWLDEATGAWKGYVLFDQNDGYVDKVRSLGDDWAALRQAEALRLCHLRGGRTKERALRAGL